jgi:pimeloyl-ACP methyl ester carboxylesterase
MTTLEIIDRPVRAPRWLKTGLNLASRVSPGLASEWGRILFFTPQKRRPTEEERLALEAGLRFSVETRHGTVAAWSFGEGPAVALLHGWGGHAGQMTPLAKRLVGAGFRAVLLDGPAHGESDGSQSSLVHFGDALAEVSRVAGPLRGIVAHSLGSAGVTFAISRDALSADRLVFVAPPCHLESFWARFRSGLGLSSSEWAQVQERSEAWLGLPFRDCTPIHLAPRMRVPLLVIHDQSDREIRIEEGRALVERWPGARMIETNGLGHARILRDESVHRAIVEAFSF